ncbi:hypothetical protein [Lunatimonas salinarum]|uniref:hypothetical protein n=1 Tax=Lunatimonas salinarum TaxID=1774590 RepID=UPI001AE0652C|nr:hypothetical protein [Lunatimonas salinarum]
MRYDDFEPMKNFPGRYPLGRLHAGSGLKEGPIPSPRWLKVSLILPGSLAAQSMRRDHWSSVLGDEALALYPITAYSAYMN